MTDPKKQQEEASNKRKVEIDDLYRFRLLSDPQVSPNGKNVAFVLTRLRKKQDDYASNIWIVPTDKSVEARKFTGSDKRDYNPRWSPDGGELGFISTRSGKPQVWIIRLDGGEARQLTRMKRGVGEFEWSTDGRWIAFTYSVEEDEYPGKPKSEEPEETGNGKTSNNEQNREPGAISEEGFASGLPPAGDWPEDEENTNDEDEKKDRVRVTTRLRYKFDGQGLLERRSHLFLVKNKGGEPKQLTHGDWDARTPRWSSDGKTLAFIANQEEDADYHNIQDIFLLPISKDGEPGAQRRVTNHDCTITNMDWLPSGEGFALFAHDRIDEGALATNLQVWTVPVKGGPPNKLTRSFDRSVGYWLNSDLRSAAGEMRPRFSRDGSLIYFMALNGGTVQIFSVPVTGGEVKQVVGGERAALNFDVSEDAVIFAASEPTLPNDLFRADLSGESEIALTAVNNDIQGGRGMACHALFLSEPEEFWIERPGGTRIQGWLLKPPDFKPDSKYPLVLQIHGGPHTSYGSAYFHEFQVMAARGYVVLYTNPRGSQGYGQEFTDVIRDDWGGIDYEDIMACVDYAMSQSYVDNKRLGLAGGSYGGYMVTWIIGHDQRFKAAVASRMVSNLYSAWGTGDMTWALWNWQFHGTPRERTDLYLERSPVTYVEEMRTPLLITHAEDDHRTNIEQAQQVYTALKLLKREVKMVLLPSGGHDVSRSGKPSVRVERMRQIVDWVDKYLQLDHNS